MNSDLLAHETIVALSSGSGRAAISVIRVTGAQTRAAIQNFFCGQKSPVRSPRTVVLGTWKDSEGTPVDQVCVAFFSAPASYTGEDMAEISCHGNPIIVDQIIEGILQLPDTRLAEAGEFTFRAFLNQKLTLPQAEGVGAIIAAQSLNAVRLAEREIRENRLHHRIDEIHALIKEISILIEADLEYGEELDSENELNELPKKLNEVRIQLADLAKRYSQTRFWFENPKVVIVGRPNVGKSALFNRLVGRDRAIVAETPGTTRDLVEATAEIGPIKARLIDSAGYRLDPEPIERMGIEKMFEELSTADLLLVVQDRSRPRSEDDEELERKAIESAPTLVVANKSDLKPAWDTLPDGVAVSAQSGEGLDRLSARVAERLAATADGSEIYLVNRRQVEAIKDAIEHLERAITVLDESGFLDQVAEEIRLAVMSLERIMGALPVEEIVRGIFGKFCIGK